MLFTAKTDLRSATGIMRREVSVVYERLRALEMACLKEAGPLRHLVLELESQAECMTLVFEDTVYGERGVRSRLLDLSSELYDLQNGRGGPLSDLDTQRGEITFLVASVGILHDRVYALETTNEFSNLLQTLDENGKILQVGCDVSQINEIRDRISRVHRVHAVSVKRLKHSYNRVYSAHSDEMARLRQTVSDKSRHVHLLQQSVCLMFRGVEGITLLNLIRDVSTHARNIARTRDVLRMYDANAARIERLKARQSELGAILNSGR